MSDDPPANENSPAAGPRRRLYVRRGRLTPAQARALGELSDRYLINLPADRVGPLPADRVGPLPADRVGPLPADRVGPLTTGRLGPEFWECHFGRPGPLAVEIGFGNGAALVAQAKSRPTWNWVGVDVYRPGLGALMLACERDEVTNVRIVDDEALAFLGRLAQASVSLINVFFPDPWPKKRHHKRRLVNADFASAVAAVLEPGGRLALATDWWEYAQSMVTVLDKPTALDGGIVARPPSRPLTPFEAKGLAAGRRVVDLVYRRRADSQA